MITLKWSRYPESDVVEYNIYRAMIGFEFGIEDTSAGKTLILKINGGAQQTLTMPQPGSTPTYLIGVITYLNSVLVGARAYQSECDAAVIIRSDLRQAPGSVEIIGGTLLSDIGRVPTLITEKSEPVMIGTVTANADPATLEEFNDCDGCLLDYYSIASVNSAGQESLKSPWQQPIQTAGDICVVEGTICNLQGVRIPDVQVTATIHESPTHCDLTYITKEPIIAMTGPDGRFSIPLLQGALVKLEIPDINYMQMVTIPRKSYTFLKDLKVDTNYTYPLGYRES